MDRQSILYYWFSLFLWIVIFQLSALASSSISSPDLWYYQLAKSSLTPPGYVFGIVWSILYTMLAVYAWSLAHIYRMGTEHRKVQAVFILHMLVNFSWSPVFFAYKQITLALFLIVLMIFMVAYVLYKSYQYKVFSGLLLVPYFFWLSFAAYLTNTILLLNN